MAERTYPGVYVEERRSGLAPIQGVSTSNFGIVGFTTQGPTNTATLVTSFPAFERTFGTFTSDSQVPLCVFREQWTAGLCGSYCWVGSGHGKRHNQE